MVGRSWEGPGDGTGPAIWLGHGGGRDRGRSFIAGSWFPRRIGWLLRVRGRRPRHARFREHWLDPAGAKAELQCHSWLPPIRIHQVDGIAQGVLPVVHTPIEPYGVFACPPPDPWIIIPCAEPSQLGVVVEFTSSKPK